MRRASLLSILALVACAPGREAEVAAAAELEEALQRGGAEAARFDGGSDLDRALAASADVARVVSAAEARNPDVEAGLARWLAALEEPRRVAPPDPVVRYRYSSMFLMHTVEGMQEVPFPTKLLADARAALAEARALRHDLAARRLLLRAEAAAAHATLALARREVEVLDEGLVLAERAVVLVRTRYESGGASQPDLLRAEVERDVLRAERAGAAGQVLEAASMLNALLDRPPAAPLGPTGPPRAPALPAELPRLLELALARRPELDAAAARVDAADGRADQADQAWLPDLQVGAGYVRDAREDEDEVELTGGVSLPVWVGRLRAGQRQAEANQRLAAAEARAARARVLDEVGRAAARVSAARERRRLLEAGALPRARQGVEASEAAYVAGSLGALELIDAQRARLRLELDLERARTAETVAAIELERAVGGQD